MTRLITVAIHTYERALALKALLEGEGIPVVLSNVNIDHPQTSSGIRVRITESDLPLALRIIENKEVFMSSDEPHREAIHPVLVPVDFSDYSMEAVKAAAQIASCHKIEIKLLHSFIDPYVAGNMQFTDGLTLEIADTETRHRLEEKANESMADFCAKIKKLMKSDQMPVVKFTSKVVEGVPEDVIMEYAKVNPPYITVMGTRGSGRKEKEMVGSVTAEVLDQAGCSVLTVPENIDGEFVNSLERILFFANLDQEDILTMDTFHRIFPHLKAEISIIDMPQRKRFFVEKSFMRRAETLVSYFLKNFPGCTYKIIDLDDIVPKPTLSSLHNNFDMVVMPNRRRSAFSRLVNQTLPHKMTLTADVPMLVIPV